MGNRVTMPAHGGRGNASPCPLLQERLQPRSAQQLGLQRDRHRRQRLRHRAVLLGIVGDGAERSEEHTSELQSLMRSSSAVFCFKTKKITSSKLHKHEKK